MSKLSLYYSLKRIMNHLISVEKEIRKIVEGDGSKESHGLAAEINNYIVKYKTAYQLSANRSYSDIMELLKGDKGYEGLESNYKLLIKNIRRIHHYEKKDRTVVARLERILEHDYPEFKKKGNKKWLKQITEKIKQLANELSRVETSIGVIIGKVKSQHEHLMQSKSASDFDIEKEYKSIEKIPATLRYLEQKVVVTLGALRDDIEGENVIVRDLKLFVEK